MYRPTAFIENDREAIQQFIQQFPLATMVCASEQGLEAHHIPLLYQAGNPALQQPDYLIGHFAKANPVWRINNSEWLIIFADNGSYISPNWYPSKAITHKEVPTWNYRAVHIRGKMELIADNTDEKLSILDRLTRHFEQLSPQPWQLSDAPPDYLTQLSKAIVAFKFEITDIQGKYKLSQNKTPENITGVLTGLEKVATPQAQQMVEAMQASAKKNKI